MSLETRHLSRLNAALAGIESGILGAAAMLAWMAAVSLLYGRSIWHYPNLLATTFYGDDALRRGFRWMTVSGLALHAVAAAVLGILFSLSLTVFPERTRVMLLGMLTAVGWYYASRALWWNWLNPVVPQYSPEAAVVFGHVVLGAVLGSSARFRRALDGPVPEPASPVD